jgi:hypothetical protein
MGREVGRHGVIEHYVKEMGMRGIKLHPEIDHFNLDEYSGADLRQGLRPWSCGVFHSGTPPTPIR